MRGIDMAAVTRRARRDRPAADRRRRHHTRDEILALDAIGIDAVVGMAVYTGTLSLDDEALQPRLVRAES